MNEYEVKFVRFDFEQDGIILEVDKQNEVVQGVLGRWLADDEDDLIGAITEYTGWCVMHIEYEEMN